ncbi:MAG: adenine phosphoribosyltransferase [Pseudonocardiales bacterium]|nr:MAG: adenine phosphoribosyltransferase [Pseudonocardiales bacterium]
MSAADAATLVAAHIGDVPDFPLPGILFKDLTPLFADGAALRQVVDALIAGQDGAGFDVVAGIEARGFVLAGAIAYATGVGMVPVRKAGKLPREALAESYALEYGEATLEVHAEGPMAGARVLVVDDVLATGGTVAATLRLVERAGGQVSGIAVVLELAGLGGRARLAPWPVAALLRV